MAVTYNTSGQSGNEVARTSASVNLTVAANADLLVVAIQSSYALSGLSVSIGGQALTLLHDWGSAGQYIYYKVNPPTGAQTVSASWSFSYRVNMSAATFIGTNPVTPFSSVTTNNGNSASVSTPISGGLDGQMVYEACYISPGGVSNSATPTASQTATMNVNDDDASPQVRSVSAHKTAAVGTNTMTWTLNGTYPWKHQVMYINAKGGRQLQAQVMA